MNPEPTNDQTNAADDHDPALSANDDLDTSPDTGELDGPGDPDVDLDLEGLDDTDEFDVIDTEVMAPRADAGPPSVDDVDATGEAPEPTVQPMATATAVGAPAGQPEAPFALHHLIFGVLFIAVGVLGLGGNADADVEWIWVGLLGAAGVAGLVAVVGSLRADRG